MKSVFIIAYNFMLRYTLEIISKVTRAFFSETMNTFKIYTKTIPRSGKIPEMSYQIYSDSHVSNFGPNILLHFSRLICYCHIIHNCLYMVQHTLLNMKRLTSMKLLQLKSDKLKKKKKHHKGNSSDLFFQTLPTQ